jgi:UDPglucose--hexose-1-phosphate uridylyltransferase
LRIRISVTPPCHAASIRARKSVSGGSGSVLSLQATPHRRYNPLLHEWVLVSPHRTERPWLGKVEKLAPSSALRYDPGCYLCPGNERAGGARNPNYTGTFVFDNDYPALLPHTPAEAVNEENLIVAESEVGNCRVGCFSPRHDLSIPQMSQTELRAMVDMWAGQFQELEKLERVRHIQIFENRGALVGASNPHPHCQIWTNATLPNIPGRELHSFEDYRDDKKSCLLCDYLRLELQRNERIVCQNEAFAVVVPFWAVWPFETLLLSKRHFGAMSDLSAAERDLLGDMLRRITARYDNIFETSFPYSMGFHQRPVNGGAYPEWHFHAHYLPPLLRSATVQKFMVGYELLGSPQRDITPESAAQRLVAASETVS